MHDSTFYSLTAKDGALNWSFKTFGWIESSPVIASDYVYILSNDGDMYCFNLTNNAFESQAFITYISHLTPAVRGDHFFAGDEEVPKLVTQSLREHAVV